MLTKLKFPHEIELEKIKFAQHMEKKVKLSPLRAFIKPDPMIFILSKECEQSEYAA
jgi:hypothetical protein